MKSNNTPRARVSFAAIGPYLDDKIVSPREKMNNSKDMMEWGDGNSFPDYLLELYNNVPTLRSVVSGCVDYTLGNNISILPLSAKYADNVVNTKGDTIEDQIRCLARDYFLYGGFALQIIRNLAGEIAEIYHIDIRHLRANKECNVFYYCEDWARSGRKRVIVYPSYMALNWALLDQEARDRQASSILYVKNEHTQTYPAPLYTASLKACEIERCIDDFHLNAIDNGFTGSYVINFNNGQPDEEIQAEIEKNFTEKFSGHQNAGRIAFCWNDNKEGAVTLEKIDVEDFGEKYKSLEANSRQKIFTAFRANPNLFGIPTESLGFSSEEYESAFKLFNRTMIKPVQKRIADAYDRIYGNKGVLTIEPFSLEANNEQIVK